MRVAGLGFRKEATIEALREVLTAVGGARGLDALATATDKAGNVATASATFTVAADETSLCALTRRFVSRANLAKELCAVLRVAELAREHGLVNARRALLNGYARAIKEIRGRYITPEDADVLIALAARI